MSITDKLLIDLLILIFIMAILISQLDVLFYNLQKRIITFLQKKKPEYYLLDTTKISRSRRIGLAILNSVLVICLGILPFTSDINNTILNQNFAISELDKLSLRSAAAELFPADLTSTQAYKTATLETTFREMGPWMKIQATQIVTTAYPYFLGQQDSLMISISLVPLETSLRTNLEKVIRNSPPDHFTFLSENAKQGYLDLAYNQFFGGLKTSLDLSSNDTPSTILSMADFRNVIVFFKTFSRLLIPLILLLTLGIILLSRQIKPIMWKLGSSFVIGGILGLTYGLILKIVGFLASGISLLSPLQSWMVQVATDAFTLVKLPSVIVIIIGVIMLIIFFILEKRHPSKVVE
jgi:hypothetical protein